MNIFEYQYECVYVLILFIFRSRNGWNNNPSALQFVRSYKRLLLHADISDGSGNCRVLDTTSVLSVSSAVPSKRKILMEDIELNDIRKAYDSADSHFNKINNLSYDVVPSLIDLNEYNENVVTYMAGYVIQMVSKTIKCTACVDLLIADETGGRNYLLMDRRNLGKISKNAY